MDLEFLAKLAHPAATKIVLLVMDGLGGLPGPEGATELEAAVTPNLDALAAEGVCGLHVPVAQGVAPGSGPAHLALFGYDPLRYQVGRGVLGALGLGFPLQPGDVAARGNFCTVDSAGVLTDRRAGRIPTETCRELSSVLAQVSVPGVQVFVEPERDYRFLLVLRGEGLSDAITETDPQEEGLRPVSSQPLSSAAASTARAVNAFAEAAKGLLGGRDSANMVLLRGFAKLPSWPAFGEVFGVRAVAVAGYPMYKGVARLVGMEAIDAPDDFAGAIDVVRASWDAFDFFYIHAKRIDSAGEDGDFARKAMLIGEIDELIPRLRALEPDVLVVTGDHSTPATIARHSWHPVPVVLWSRTCRADLVTSFGERACIAGGLGPNFPAVDLMPLAMANAHRLGKFGA